MVDDNVGDRRLIALALRTGPWHVEIVEAATGEEAVRAAFDDAFDAIFLDYLLPDLDGIVVLERLREAGVETPVVAMTGHGDEKVAMRFLELGASDYFVKGDVSDLRVVHTVQNVLTLHRLTMRLRLIDRDGADSGAKPY